ncbi:MAG: prephenate dehydrogenase [Armatimonadetes bacterium]|nr:prephenate dehydrogenase [Anaerolineae bacterium]
MADITIGILGMGRLGASLGLALHRHNAKPDAHNKFTITGYTNIGAHLKAAQKLDTAHSWARNAADAARGRDIVVLAMPYAEVEATYELIGSVLRSGTVVLDFSPLKQPSQAWAAKYLPKDAHLLGVTPILNPKYLFDGIDEPERASADAFQDGRFLLTPSINCLPAAIDLGRDFAALLGADSAFMDALECDSLLAGTRGLPALLGLAYAYMMQRSPGWDDAQRLTNAPFGMLTHTLFDTHPDDLRDEWLANRDALLTYTDALMTALRGLRRALAENDRDTLESAVSDAAKEYEGWYNRRRKSQWEQDPAGTPPDAPGLLSGLLGGALANRLRGKREDS